MKVMSRKTMQNVAAQYAIDHYQEICFNAVEKSTPYIVRQTVAAVLWALKLHGYGEKRLNDVFRWTCEVMSMPKVMGQQCECDDAIEYMAERYNIDFSKLHVKFQRYKDYVSEHQSKA